MDRVVIVGFEGAQTLDLTGPAEVFATAGRHLGHPVYKVVAASVGGGAIGTSSGFEVATRAAKTLAAQCGFGSTARMKRAFQRELGVAPREYRWLFSAKGPDRQGDGTERATGARGR